MRVNFSRQWEEVEEHLSQIQGKKLELEDFGQSNTCEYCRLCEQEQIYQRWLDSLN